MIDILDYGAKCDGITDDSQAINAASSAWREANRHGHGARLVFPARGTCLIKTPMDITQVYNFGAILDGHGAVILCETGSLCLDATGTNRTMIANLTIRTSRRSKPKIGIQWARESERIGCGNDKAQNLTVIGDYTFAAIYIEACENMSWTDTYLENEDPSPSAWVLVEDGSNYWGAESSFQTISIGRDTLHGMDELAWMNPIFQQKGPGHIMWLGTSHTTQMLGNAYGLQYATGIAPVVLFDDGVGHNGNLVLDMHFEATGQTNIFEFDGSNPTPILYGLRWTDRGSQLKGPVFLRGPGVAHVSLENANIQINQFLHRPPAPKMFDDPGAWTVSGDMFLPSLVWWNQPKSWTGCITTLESARQCSLGSVTTIPEAGPSQSLVFAASGDNSYDITLSAPLRLTLSGGSPGQAQRLTLVLRQPAATDYPVSLPANIDWTGHAPPATRISPGKAMVFSFLTLDGGATYLGWQN